MTQEIKIAPSILSADFARLGDDVRTVVQAGAHEIHVDVMDGHFVPNISIGPLIVQALRPVTTLPLDVHLMITEPDRYLEAFAKAGADTLTVHIEACPHIHRTIQYIHALGVRAGVSLNPGTPASSLAEILPEVDLVLVMSVNPGFGGQSFIPSSLAKIAQIRAILDKVNPTADLSVDGGIGENTIGPVVAAGANHLVAGSAIYNAPNGPTAAVATLYQIARQSRRVQ